MCMSHLRGHVKGRKEGQTKDGATNLSSPAKVIGRVLFCRYQRGEVIQLERGLSNGQSHRQQSRWHQEGMSFRKARVYEPMPEELLRSVVFCQ